MEAKKYDKKIGDYEDLRDYRMFPKSKGELEGLVEGGKNGK